MLSTAHNETKSIHMRESSDPEGQTEKSQTESLKSHRDPVSSKDEPVLIVLGGPVFLVLAAIAFVIAIGSVGVIEWQRRDKPPLPLQDTLAFYLPPFFSLIIGLGAAVLGFMLLRIAGRSIKEVIPRENYALLSKMLFDGNHDGITDYIRLDSLSGIIGAFTKLGISGFPLATIGLTVFFSILALLVPTQAQSSLFDLAKLTLGAFIGSFVRSQGTEPAKQAIEARAPVANQTAATSEKSPSLPTRST
jgi:hypothetical protein